MYNESSLFYASCKTHKPERICWGVNPLKIDWFSDQLTRNDQIISRIDISCLCKWNMFINFDKLMRFSRKYFEIFRGNLLFLYVWYVLQCLLHPSNFYNHFRIRFYAVWYSLSILWICGKHYRYLCCLFSFFKLNLNDLALRSKTMCL